MHLRLLGIVLFLTLTLCESAPALCDTITPTMRMQDARLNQTISINAPSITLGELLAKYSEQTGVRIHTDERDPLSGLRLCVACDKMPLGDMLDSLWSLLSYRDAAWKWERSGKPGAFQYEFTPSRAALDFPPPYQADGPGRL